MTEDTQQEQQQEPGTDLIPHPVTGEAIAIKSAGTDELAAWLVRSQEIRDQLQDFDAVLNAELLERMDKRLVWTHRVGDPKADVNLELTAPSPTAGTTSYQEGELEPRLKALIEGELLDPAVLDEVVPRRVTITAQGRDTGRLERYAERAGAKVDVSTSVSVQAVNKLAKIDHPQINEAIEAAKVTTPQSSRKVKIKPIEKAKVKRG